MPRDIAFDPDNELVRTDTGREYRWQGEINHCHVCAAADRARRLYEQAARSDDVGEVNRDGLIVLISDRAATGT